MNDTDSSLDIPKQELCAFCDYLTFTVLCRNDLIAVLVTREQRGISVTSSYSRCGTTRPCSNPNSTSVMR